MGTYQPPTPPENNVSYPNFANTGIEIPAGVVVRVSVTGVLTFNTNSGYTICYGQSPPQLPGGATEVGPAGFDPYRQYAVVAGLGTATVPPGSGFGLQPATASAESVSAVVAGPGVVWASRPALIYGACENQQTGYQPAYYVDGTQTISATVLAPPVIDVDRTTIVTGDTVDAELNVSWTEDVQVRYGWEWVPSGYGTATFVSGCGWTDETCRVAVTGDGYLRMPYVFFAQAVYVTPVSPVIHVAPASLILVADSTHVTSGSAVTFTARRSDGQPLQVDSWEWTPGSQSPLGPLAADCAGGDSLCVTTLQNTTPAESAAAQTGTMTAIALLGTASESASVAVTVDAASGGGGGGGCGSAPAMSGRAVAQLTCPPDSGSVTIALSFGSGGDSVSLHPRIRGMPVNGIEFAEREPDTATVNVLVKRDGSPVTGVAVTLRAEFLPNTGGHAHIHDPIRFETGALAPTGPEATRPIYGYFITSSGQKRANLSATSDSSGAVQSRLVAGYVGGAARVIASASVDGAVVADSAIVAYVVPGLVKLEDSVTGAYWIGGDAAHEEGDNHYAQDSVVARLQTIADSMQSTVNGTTLYLQYNDASLPDGGTFSVTPTPVQEEHPYSEGHTAHNTGLDIDIALCYAVVQGEDGQTHRVRSCDSAPSHKVDFGDLDREACAQHGKTTLHAGTGPHYHLRFVGSNDNVPGCSEP